MTNKDGAEVKGQDQGGQQQPEKQLDKEPNKLAGQDLELLKKDLAGKDSKINELVKQNKELMSKFEQIEKAKKERELAEKTAEEQLKEYQSKVKQFEQKEAYRQAFKDVGLNPDDFASIVNETNPALQAQKFSELLKEREKQVSDKTLEDFKKEQLEKVDKKQPNLSNKPDDSSYENIFKDIQKKIR